MVEQSAIGARRNVNIWILIAAMALGDVRHGFILIVWWMGATALAHSVRAIQISKMTKAE